MPGTDPWFKALVLAALVMIGVTLVHNITDILTDLAHGTAPISLPTR